MHIGIAHTARMGADGLEPGERRLHPIRFPDS